MKLFLVRHGIAVENNAPGVTGDNNRSLSEGGFVRTRAAAGGAARAGIRPERILTSPLLRAHQTAEIFASALDVATVEKVDELVPEGDVGDLLFWLSRQPPSDALMLVGHMPSLAILMSVLLCGTDENILHLKKAGICRLTLEDGILPGTAYLDWLLPPKLLRLLAPTSE